MGREEEWHWVGAYREDLCERQSEKDIEFCLPFVGERKWKTSSALEVLF